jgi:SAM-dependent methyltransferase
MNDILNKLHLYNPYDGFNINLYKDDLSGWHGNHHIFFDLFKNIRPKLVLEIGTWKGQSAINMSKIIKEFDFDTKIVCVDTWLGSIDFINAESRVDYERDTYPQFGYPQIYYQFLSNVIRHRAEDIIIPFPQTSSIACKWLLCNQISFDLIYIDGSNDYTDVILDIESSWPLLKDNGVIFGDDYNNGSFPDIKKAVDNFCYRYNQQHNFETYDNDLFWLIKKIP